MKELVYIRAMGLDSLHLQCRQLSVAGIASADADVCYAVVL
jgi:hypothetical protein